MKSFYPFLFVSIIWCSSCVKKGGLTSGIDCCKSNDSVETLDTIKFYGALDLDSLFFCPKKKGKTTIKKQLIPFTETGLKSLCLGNMQTLNDELHGIAYIDDAGEQIEIDSVANLLRLISAFDDFNKKNCNSYILNQKQIWEKVSSKEHVYRIEKVSVALENFHEIDYENTAPITLTDYYIYLTGSPSFISVRGMNDEYDVITIILDNKKIHQLSEIIPFGLDKAIEKLDSVKNFDK